MTFLWRFVLACALSCTAIAAAPLGAENAKIIRMGFDPWMPYAAEAGAPQRGYTIEIVTAIFEANGFEVRTAIMPYARLLVLIANNEIDMMPAIPFIPKEVTNFYDAMLFAKERIGVSEPVFVKRADDPWTYSGLGSLEGRTLGIINTGDWYKEEAGTKPADEGNFINSMQWYVRTTYRKNPASINIISSTNAIPNAIKMVAVGRLDCYVEDRNTAIYYASISGIRRRIDFAPTGSARLGIYPVFSRKDPRAHQLATLFDRGIRAMRQSGRLKAILDTYGLSDWK